MKTNFPTVLLGVALASLSVPALRAAPPAARSSVATRATPKQIEQMQARMRLMQEQMRRIRETNSPAERARLLREHMQTMLEQMQAMRAFGGSTMYGMMGRRGTGRGMMGGGMMGGGNAAATPSERRQWMQDRLDLMQMMMEQMMSQLQASQGAHSAGK
ncbi:MAG: hypothetical protein ACLGP3_03860 [Acidobacteriota bacterium]